MKDEKLEHILEQTRDENIKLLRELYIDLDNIIRGHEAFVDESRLISELKSGMTLAEIMQSGFTLFDTVTPGTIFTSYGEVRLIPDLTTFKILPYAKNTAQVIGDLYRSDMKPFETDPRLKFKEMLANIPYKIIVGIEPELYFFKKDDLPELVPMDNHLCFATTGMNIAEDIVLDVLKISEDMGIPLYHYYPEYGKGQHEFSLRPIDALYAADALIYFREVIRNVASKYNLSASFMPKPASNLPGSGLHIHLSLWEDNSNIFYDESDKYYLSDTAYHFIGGILDHLDSLIAFTAASVNSYKRLIPHNWASAYKCWGPLNREAAIRVPLPIKGETEKSMNLELKFIDITGQPYLALGSIIAAGIDGIKRKLDSGEPCLEDPGDLTDKTRCEKGWTRYPETLIDAIRKLEKDKFFRNVWGNLLVDEYIKIKKYHWAQYYSFVTKWERDHFLEVY